jgi:hypothetical protein
MSSYSWSEGAELICKSLDLPLHDFLAFAKEDCIGGYPDRWPVGSVWEVEGKVLHPDGIVRLDEEHFVDQVNALTPDDYYKRLPAIEDNYQRALQYVPWDQYAVRCVQN